MHEFSIVNALLDMCEKNAKEHGSNAITKVEVKIGKLSGVEPDLLQRAFDTFKEDSVCASAEFVIHLQNVVIACEACGTQSVITDNHFVCPTCKSTECSVVDGEEMMLMRLEME